jgi:hypothetical protein
LLHSLLPTLCTGVSGIPPVLPISMCVRMQEAVRTYIPSFSSQKHDSSSRSPSQTRRCLPGIQAACYDTHDTMDCEGLGSWCEAELLIPAIDLGLNPYDISRPCDGGLAETLCYPETRWADLHLKIRFCSSHAQRTQCAETSKPSSIQPTSVSSSEPTSHPPSSESPPPKLPTHSNNPAIDYSPPRLTSAHCSNEASGCYCMRERWI